MVTIEESNQKINSSPTARAPWALKAHIAISCTHTQVSLWGLPVEWIIFFRNDPWPFLVATMTVLIRSNNLIDLGNEFQTKWSNLGNRKKKKTWCMADEFKPDSRFFSPASIDLTRMHNGEDVNWKKRIKLRFWSNSTGYYITFILYFFVLMQQSGNNPCTDLLWPGFIDQRWSTSIFTPSIFLFALTFRFFK